MLAGKNNPIIFLVLCWKLTLIFLKDLTITVKSQEDSQNVYYECAQIEMLKVVEEKSRELLKPKNLASPPQASSLPKGEQGVAKVSSKLRE